MSLTPMLEYISNYWPKLVRQNSQDTGTLIGLPCPYIVPSHEGFFQEMYYWDSYFMGLGVDKTEHETLIVDMAENMAHLLQRFGLIPNGNRYYFLSRSQPPFFTRMIVLASEVIKRRQSEAEAQAFIERMLPLAEKEYETVWMGTQQPHNRKVYAGLSRYFDINFLDDLASCESGWDHTTRCDGHWLGYLPVDLNSILYFYETDMADFYQQLGQTEMSASWKSRAEQRRATMQELMWDAAAGFFLDYDFENKRRNSHPSLAGFYPMWAGLATESQAERIVREWLPRFEFPGGLVTTLTEQKGKQWAYPNGWAPLTWLVVQGLDRYGYTTEAMRIREKWYTNCEKVFWTTGCLWEKYNVVAPGQIPESGVYGSIHGFGWSNAVTWDFAGHLGKR